MGCCQLLSHPSSLLQQGCTPGLRQVPGMVSHKAAKLYKAEKRRQTV